MAPIIFWGATGQAKVVREFIGDLGYRLVAVFDNNPDVPPPFADVPLAIGMTAFRRWREANPGPLHSLVTIGGDGGPARLTIQQELQTFGVGPIIAAHPSAYVAKNATLGPGCQILARAVVGAEARLGEACIVNTAAGVDHECVLGDGVHIAPGAVLAGCVRVGCHTFVGAGAVILPRITLGSNVVVGAGAVVTRDVPDGCLVRGIPARVARSRAIPQAA